MNSNVKVLSAALATVMCMSAPAHAGLLGGSAGGGLGGGMSGGMGHLGGINGTGTLSGNGAFDATRPSLGKKSLPNVPAKSAADSAKSAVGDAKGGATQGAKDAASDVTQGAKDAKDVKGQTTTTVAGTTATAANAATAAGSGATAANAAKPAPAAKPTQPQPVSGSLSGSTDQSMSAAGHTVDGSANGSAAARHGGRDTSASTGGNASADVTRN